MSGIAKAIKKVFKSKIFKAIVVVAAVWFTAGTASAYFAAPQAGLGAAMSTSASTMWTQTATFFGADVGASSVVTSQTGAVATPLAGDGVGAAIPLSESVAGAVPAAAETAVTAAPGAAAGAAAPAAATQGGGMFAWLKANPMATMMLGQGAAGAYGGYLEDKQEQREADERANRGLMGFDAGGNFAGKAPATTDEVVAEPQLAATERQATVAPIVASQQIAAPAVPGQQVQVPREDLTKLNQQGQIARRG